MKKKITIDHIEQIAALLKQGLDLHTIFTLLTSLYGIDFLTYEKYQLEGKGSFYALKQLYDHPLYQEMMLFYKEYQPLDEAMINSIRLIQLIKDFKKKLISILIYPAILLISVLSFSLFVLFYLRPQFFNFYESFQIRLSLLHQCLLNILFYFPLLIFLVILVFITICIYSYVMIMKQDHEQIKKLLAYPMIGKSIRIYFSLRFMIYFKEFVKNNVPFHLMLTFFKTKTNDQLIETIAYEIERNIEMGKSIESIIQESIYFDSYFKTIYILSLSLEGKEQLYQSYIDTQMNQIFYMIQVFKNIITPITYIFVGIYIIGIYSLMVLPMTNMISTL